MRRVGVRELRQDASGLLNWIESTGLAIEISNRGRPVARLVPITTGTQTRTALLTAGALRPGRGDPLDIVAMLPPAGSPTTTDVLADERADR